MAGAGDENRAPGLVVFLARYGDSRGISGGLVVPEWQNFDVLEAQVFDQKILGFLDQVGRIASLENALAQSQQQVDCAGPRIAHRPPGGRTSHPVQPSFRRQGRLALYRRAFHALRHQARAARDFTCLPTQLAGAIRCSEPCYCQRPCTFYPECVIQR